VITGPNNFNAPDIARALLDQRAALEVSTSAQLATTLQMLFDDRVRREAMGARALAFLVSNKGALHRLLALLEPHLK
jgi:3-deoxy-D-manno-octulosonic-acid transferase